MVACFFCFWFSASIFAADPIDAARDFLEQNRAFRGTIGPSADFDTVREKIASMNDPKTKFGYVVFSVARHSKKLLSDEQAEAISKIIEARKNAEVNWHDIRNVVRVHAQIRLWKYAAKSDAAEAKKLRADWKAWNDLRIAFMFEEFVAQERFQRAAWDVLTVEQRKALLSSEWDPFLKKSMGHGRLFSANKQVQRVFGKADDENKFDAAVDHWEKAWEPVFEYYQAASEFQRKREFSMDDAGENFAAASWKEYASAFRGFSETECDAIRGLVQAGYEKDAEFLNKITNFQTKLRADMVKKYESNAAEFLRRLGVM